MKFFLDLYRFDLHDKALNSFSFCRFTDEETDTESVNNSCAATQPGRGRGGLLEPILAQPTPCRRPAAARWAASPPRKAGAGSPCWEMGEHPESAQASVWRPAAARLRARAGPRSPGRTGLHTHRLSLLVGSRHPRLGTRGCPLPSGRPLCGGQPAAGTAPARGPRGGWGPKAAFGLQCLAGCF